MGLLCPWFQEWRVIGINSVCALGALVIVQKLRFFPSEWHFDSNLGCWRNNMFHPQNVSDVKLLISCLFPQFDGILVSAYPFENSLLHSALGAKNHRFRWGKISTLRNLRQTWSNLTCECFLFGQIVYHQLDQVTSWFNRPFVWRTSWFQMINHPSKR